MAPAAARSQLNQPAPISTYRNEQRAADGDRQGHDAVLQAGLPARYVADLPWFAMFEPAEQKRAGWEPFLSTQAIDAALAVAETPASSSGR